MLYSIGKDSAVMLHLAKKAFFPGPLPFPLLHVDTTWKFRDMYALRDKVAADPAVELIVYKNPEAESAGINPFDHGPLHTDMWKTEGLKQALDKYGFDAAFGGARRDEEKSRAKERIFSFRDRNHAGTRSASGPSCGRSTMSARPRARACASSRSSNWTELDVWQYILRERIEIVPLYFAAERPTVERDGLILMVDDERMPLEPGEAAADAHGAVPDARLLSADRRGRERGRDASKRSSRRCCAATTSRAAGPRDRPRRRRATHGEEEAGGLFLNAPADIAKLAGRAGAKELLRFITCGSVDDGKSTLIGRLLYDTKLIFDDQLAALEARQQEARHAGRGASTSRCWSTGCRPSASRASPSTSPTAISPAEKRKFIVADTPGHEQYTRNMVTGASTADLAVLLVDARKGVLTQTRRHTYLAQLLGIRHFVLAVNKMDLVDYDQAAFDAIVADYRAFADQIGIDDWRRRSRCPALSGDNVGERSAGACPGTAGRRLLEHLETVPLDATPMPGKPFRHAGAVGQPPEPGLPRLRRADRVGQRYARRRGARAAVGPDHAGRARSSPPTATSRRRSPASR